MQFEDLDTSFFQRRALIARLRSQMPVFDEICRDYCAMHDELVRIENQVSPVDTVWRASVTETLAALHEEIAATLEDQAACLERVAPPYAPQKKTIQKRRKT
ncbi:hypothetical protein [Tropicimonas sp. S265A]|uniref:hypothetical protein n=1 Tax=Tropicimonas sp. S265A TaxID=3415134 RepID=UPI003C7CC8A4